MIVIFIGPPFAGKDTQTNLLSETFNIPALSMGAIIREAYEKGDPRAIEGFENYYIKGMHVPDKLKFPLLEKQMDEALNGFILDNFPATQEDVETFNNYLAEKGLKVDSVFLITISEEEIFNRMKAKARGRKDDTKEIVMKRKEIQDKDREAVIKFYTENNLLHKINGEGTVEEVHQQILDMLNSK